MTSLQGWILVVVISLACLSITILCLSAADYLQGKKDKE